jgi:hypothetical protein
MVRKLVVIIGLIIVVGFSFSLLTKGKTEGGQIKNKAQPVAVSLPDTVFAYNSEVSSLDCESTNGQFCAVEQAVKCTINPQLAGCDKLDLPKFIFMQDAGLDRPTEVSYKITGKKVLSNDTVEIYTDSSCNGGWFGLCQGTVIYVLSSADKKNWQIKDIYAIE